MTTIRILFVWLAATLIGAAPSVAAGPTIEFSTIMAERILALHNRERAAVGAPPMVWDDMLARAAASYGPTLVSLGHLQHSPRESRPGQRENLAMGTPSHYDYVALAGLWVAEKRNFSPGAFPNVSRTGNWLDVSHYTQMIWKGTTHVGCALQHGGERDYLICRYSPPGNADGVIVP